MPKTTLRPGACVMSPCFRRLNSSPEFQTWQQLLWESSVPRHWDFCVVFSFGGDLACFCVALQL